MKKRKALAGAILYMAAIGAACISGLGAASAAQTEGLGVPAYHTQLPAGPLPATLEPHQFAQPEIQNAYAIAARIKKTLYRQPCYCHCDRSQGHGSLLDCYVSVHASVCEICMRETFYAREQLGKGKTAEQIRDGINRGDWQQVDVSKYQTCRPTPAKNQRQVR